MNPHPRSVHLEPVKAEYKMKEAKLVLGISALLIGYVFKRWAVDFRPTLRF
jgi:hypothetical protein